MEDAPTRRTVLLSAAAVIVAGAAGAGYAVVRPEPSQGRAAAPPELVAAAAAESELIALIDAVMPHPDGLALLSGIRNDHSAHLVALQAALADYPGTRPATIGTQAPPPSPRRGSGGDAVTQVAAAEQRAATAAAARARVLDGALATLLASIAACEATHAGLLES